MSLSSIGVGGVGGGSITVKEVDGAPSVTTSTLRVPNTYLTDDGGGQATLAFPASSSLTVKEVDGAPSVSGVTTLRVPNTLLTDDGGGQVTLSSPAATYPTVKEIDGSPSVSSVSTIRVSNGTLTDDGGGQVTINTAGSGGGITAASSLGSAGTAGTAKFLTTDNRLYIDDGSNWRPMDSPGWIRYDATDDEEHETADPYSWDNQSSTSVDYNSARPSHIIFTATNTANIAVYYKSAPASPSNKNYYAQLCMETSLGQTLATDQTEFGIAVRNSSNGKIMAFVLTNISTGLPDITLRVEKWTNSSTFSADAFRGSIHGLGLSRIVLNLKNDGTNIICQYAFEQGGAVVDFITVFSETIATFIGSWDQIGYAMRNNTAATQRLISDWFRIT